MIRLTAVNSPTAQHYFSGGNTASGFVSYYDYIFRDLDRLYIIKGAPGTGKSKLMRDIANEACNRNYTIEYYHCASDPDSLDGIIIRDISVGVLDGTAPHVGVRRQRGSVVAFYFSATRRRSVPQISS